MSEDQLKAFLEAAKTDAGLQEQLKVATDADAVVAMAKEVGFDVNKSDWLKWRQAIDAPEIQELNDDDLETLSGGTDGAMRFRGAVNDTLNDSFRCTGEW